MLSEAFNTVQRTNEIIIIVKAQGHDPKSIFNILENTYFI